LQQLTYLMLPYANKNFHIDLGRMKHFWRIFEISVDSEQGQSRMHLPSQSSIVINKFTYNSYK